MCVEPRFAADDCDTVFGMLLSMLFSIQAGADEIQVSLALQPLGQES